jgi:hypothetical protein
MFIVLNSSKYSSLKWVFENLLIAAAEVLLFRQKGGTVFVSVV